MVDLSGAELAAAQNLPHVLAVTADETLQPQTTTALYNAAADANSMYSIGDITGARDVWTTRGITGKGVDIALLDSGVTPVAGLESSDKLVQGPDLSFESQVPSLRNLDTFGHGTHMAGIMAGRDAGVDPRVPTIGAQPFMGIAPNARVISLKLADSNGATDVSQVIAGIDWVVKHAKDPGYNIRIINLSYGTPSRQSYVLDPLAHAAEQAWLRGIVVVASAGNDGTGTGKLMTPAQDPYVIAVGAADTRGTKNVVDDEIPAFSTQGDASRDPDLVAPGRSVQSLRVPGSYIDAAYGAGAGSINERFFRGSGTSQSAAVVSGAAALLLEQRPSLRPDQVKSLLTGTAMPLPSADRKAQGNGLVDVAAAAAAATPYGYQSCSGRPASEPSRGRGEGTTSC